MKNKKTFIVFVTVFAAMLIISGCSSGGESSSDAEGSKASLVSQESSKPESSKASEQTSSQKSEDEGFVDFGSGKEEGKTLSDFFDDPDYAYVIKGAEEKLSNKYYDVKISVEGKSVLVLTASPKDGTDPESEKAGKALEQTGTRAAALLNRLIKLTGDENITLELRRENSEGSVAETKKYTASDSSTEEQLPTLAELGESSVLLDAAKALADSLGNFEDVTAEVQGDNTVVVGAVYPDVIPEGAESAVEEKIDGASSQVSSMISKLCILTGETEIYVRLVITDSTGREVASRTY